MADSLTIMQNNPLLYTSENVPDSNYTSLDSNYSELVVNRFLSDGNTRFIPIEIVNNNHTDYIIYGIIVLAGVIAFIWHFMPNRFKTIFSFKTEVLRRNDNQDPVGVGTFITAIFSLNFFLVTGLFLLLVVNTFDSNIFNEINFYESLLYSYLILLGFISFRTFLIYFLSLIFKTINLRRKQVIISKNILFITGVILLPVIPVLLYTSSVIAVYIVVGIVVILQALRVIKIISIGISDTMFSAFHIILYLCALEIAPVLVLVRLIGNSSVL